MKLRRIPMPTTRREMKTKAPTMNSCVPDYLIQGNGTVYTIDSCYKNGGPHWPTPISRPDRKSDSLLDERIRRHGSRSPELRRLATELLSGEDFFESQIRQVQMRDAVLLSLDEYQSLYLNTYRVNSMVSEQAQRGERKA
uniref:Uncharacterized protein n=1 Tax=Oryza sativa subsp. indica TaxID=39946 RepID=A0A679B9F1_ORYSI|nr:hypothetical protein [Oryza sativa Indica Group]BBD82339.1 hypothetical protein [Oryza sativa Indica Group]